MTVQVLLENASRVSDIARIWATHGGSSLALRDSEWLLTYAELWEAIVLATGRLAEAGIACGDRVMLVSENCVQQVALTLACSELRAWPVNVNTRLSGREIESIRDNCQPRLILFSSAVSADAHVHAVRLGASPWRGDDFFAGFAILRGRCELGRENETLACDVAVVLYTSGTTGAPKGVMVSHHGLLHFARVSCASRGLGSADRVYGVLPLAHIFGFATALLSTLYAGACLSLERRFTPDRLLKVLSQEGITNFQGGPTLFTRVLEHLKKTAAPLHAPRLRYLYSGGSSLDMAVKRVVEATLGLPLHQGYGMTEYAGSMFITRVDEPRDDDSSGHRNAGVELRLLDESGHEVPPGQAGVIQVRGPGVMRGYYRNSEATDEVLSAEGWLTTGDLGRIDDTGALFIVGRSKGLVIRSGFKVYPVEVESVLNAWPAIQLSTVVGFPETDGNEEVIAFIELCSGQRLDKAGLHTYLKREPAPYKRPGRIVVLSSIPITINGKLQKLRLREWLQEGGSLDLRCGKDRLSSDPAMAVADGLQTVRSRLGELTVG